MAQCSINYPEGVTDIVNSYMFAAYWCDLSKLNSALYSQGSDPDKAATDKTMDMFEKTTTQFPKKLGHCVKCKCYK